MSRVWIVFLKEMREVLRDRRALIFMLVLPTFGLPMMFSLLFSFMAKQEATERERVLKVAFVHAELLPELVALFKADKGFEAVAAPAEHEVAAAIRAEKLDLVIHIPEDVHEFLAANYSLKLSMTFDNAAVQSLVMKRAGVIVENYANELRKQRLSRLGVTGMLEQNGFVEPVQISKIGIADRRETLGNAVGGMLPYLFIILCFLGSVTPAIDLGAGEKERLTLETLLLTPVPRAWLVWGKFLVIFTSGMITALLSVMSFGGWIALRGKDVAGELGQIIAAIGVADVALIFLMMVPLSAIFAALLLSISIYARSFKEAQSTIVPLNFLVILPAAIGSLPGVSLDWKWSLVPITNVSLAVKELVKGTMDYTMLGFIFLSTVILATVAIRFCVKWFQREDVLFRS